MSNITAWYTYPDNVSGFGAMFQWANATVSNTLGNMICVVAFLIAFIILNLETDGESSKSLTVAAFLSTLLGIFLYRINMITPEIVYVFIFLTILGFIWSVLNK